MKAISSRPSSFGSFAWTSGRAFAALAAGCLTYGAAQAADWPQWLGPDRDGAWKEEGIVERFAEGGPKILWRSAVSGGYSGPAVADGKVFVADYVLASGDPTAGATLVNDITGQERILCFDAKTGKELWKHSYERAYRISYPAGPRCTPSVSEGLVYAVGAQGDLRCLQASDGKLVWSKYFPTDYGAKTPQWGFAGHPLVYKNLVVCLVGGEGSVAVAFDKRTGKEVWKALSSAEQGYAPPTLIEAGGTTQLIIYYPEAIASLKPETGELYWSVPFAPDYGMSIMAPQKGGDYLFAGGHQEKSICLKLDSDKPGAAVAWKGDNKTGMGPKNSTPLAVGEYVYGSDGDGQIRCMKIATGERLWTSMKAIGDRRLQSGTVFTIRHADRWFLFTEKGELIIAKLTPEGYEEISRAKVIEPTGESNGRFVVWTCPAFADKCAFIRNDKEVICVSLAKE